ncbi:TRAPP complex subunit Trs23 [Gymnopus androsaceus JB14]|uniref:Trafficking protein particle complex subunit n=1 Tax=Gymnopus androsaceus JB14 TaxID=1447944 RepID=A0A6A4IKJ9_9AGAR|nr:TRAPP complex subunit Trs23 [Gymnopus androsaceus JB14]
MAIFGLWVINKAGGLVYQRTFADGLAQLTSNEYLVLAGTLHGIHAITSRLSPIPGQSSGAQVIEGETFKMNVLLTLTGTKFILLTSPAETSSSIDALLQKIYTAYSEKVMQNPFHTPEMPIRSEAFDVSLGALVNTGH